MLFRGEKKIDQALLRVIDYNADNFEEDTINSANDVVKYQEKNSVIWLIINEMHDTVSMEEIATTFHLDQLIIADVMNTQARPKVREYDNWIFLSIKMLPEPVLLIQSLEVVQLFYQKAL